MVTLVDKSNNEKYTLTFTRRTASEAEKAGFIFDKDKLENMPVTSLMLLFAYSFKAKQPQMSVDEALDIVGNTKDKGGLLNALIKDYANAIETLMGEPDEDSKNAMEWTES